MHEKIKDIQTSFWKAYAHIANTRNMEQFVKDVNEITFRYEAEEDEEIRLFLNNTLLAWWGLALAIKDGHFDN